MKMTNSKMRNRKAELIISLLLSSGQWAGLAGRVK